MENDAQNNALESELRPSLNYKVRAVVDSVCELARDGIRMEDLFKEIRKRHNITHYELKKIFRSELQIDLGNTKKLYERVLNFEPKKEDEI